MLDAPLTKSADDSRGPEIILLRQHSHATWGSDLLFMMSEEASVKVTRVRHRSGHVRITRPRRSQYTCAQDDTLSLKRRLVPTSASDSLRGLFILIYTGWHVKEGYKQST